LQFYKELSETDIEGVDIEKSALYGVRNEILCSLEKYRSAPGKRRRRYIILVSIANIISFVVLTPCIYIGGLWLIEMTLDRDPLDAAIGVALMSAPLIAPLAYFAWVSVENLIDELKYWWRCKRDKNVSLQIRRIEKRIRKEGGRTLPTRIKKWLFRNSGAN